MNKNTLMIGVGMVLTVVLVVLLWFYFDNRIVDDNDGFKVNADALIVPVYKDVKVSDLIELIDGKIIDDEKIDTKSLGDKSVSFIYLNEDDKKRRGTFTITVKDKEKPLIWLTNSYRVKVNSKVNLAKEIMCADNYDKKPTCVIEGDYNLDVVGDYPLSYVAQDSSGNQSKVDFVLHVYDSEENPGNKVDVPVSTTSFSDVLTTYKTADNEVGIDVSKWQGNVDFSKVKAAGATFVMLRVGAQDGVGGKYVLDPFFEKNIKEALKNKLKVGIYFYSYANGIKEAKQQARWVLKQIKDYDVTLPVAFDWECYASFNEMEMSIFGLNEVANAFLNEVKKHDYETMLYGSKNYLNAIWNYHKHDVWLAHYAKKTDYQGDYLMWQLCQNGVIDGVDKMVDINVFNRKFNN